MQKRHFVATVRGGYVPIAEPVDADSHRGRAEWHPHLEATVVRYRPAKDTRSPGRRRRSGRFASIAQHHTTTSAAISADHDSTPTRRLPIGVGGVVLRSIGLKARRALGFDNPKAPEFLVDQRWHEHGVVRMYRSSLSPPNSVECTRPPSSPSLGTREPLCAVFVLACWRGVRREHANPGVCCKHAARGLVPVSSLRGLSWRSAAVCA